MKVNLEGDNKLIAEFMELPTEIMGAKEVIYGMNHDDWYTADNLNQHLSWDWLMPVVEKIESLGYEFTIIESRCNINHNTDHSVEELFHIETVGSKLDTTYQAVVQFINQYNKTI